MGEYKYPFAYKLEDNINLFIEHVDGDVTSFWFYNHKEKLVIPEKFKLYKVVYREPTPQNKSDKEYKLLSPYPNTQTFAVATGTECIIEYDNKTIIRLSTIMHPCIPPIIKHTIDIL